MEGVRGSSYLGDIAIDDFKFRKGSCDIVPVSANPLISTTPPATTVSPTTISGNKHEQWCTFGEILEGGGRGSQIWWSLVNQIFLSQDFNFHWCIKGKKLRVISNGGHKLTAIFILNCLHPMKICLNDNFNNFAFYSQVSSIMHMNSNCVSCFEFELLQSSRLPFLRMFIEIVFHSLKLLFNLYRKHWIQL